MKKTIILTLGWCVLGAAPASATFLGQYGSTETCAGNPPPSGYALVTKAETAGKSAFEIMDMIHNRLKSYMENDKKECWARVDAERKKAEQDFEKKHNAEREKSMKKFESLWLGKPVSNRPVRLDELK